MKLREKLTCLLAPSTAVFLLIGMIILGAMRPGPSDAEPYHQAIKSLTLEMPYQIGPWNGVDMELDWSAVKLLRPNAIIKRKYTHEITGRTAWFVLIQCKDARDMGGHYPPECYPANGWEVTKAERYEWRMDDVTVPGMQYHVRRHGIHAKESRNANIIILPDGRFVRRMDEVWEVASDYYRHYYGAAQIQVVCNEPITQNEFDEIVVLFINHAEPVIEMIRSGDSDQFRRISRQHRALNETGRISDE